MQPQLLNLFFLTGGKLLRIPLVIISTSLLARALGPEGMGQWAMLLAVTTFLHTFLLSWTQAPNIRFGREEWTLHYKLSDTWASRWPIIGIGITLAAVLLITQPFSFLKNAFNLSPTWWPLIMFFLLGQWWLAESQSLFRICDKIGRFTTIPLLIDSLTIVFLFTIFFQPIETRIISAIIGMVVIMTITSVIVWFIEFQASGSWGGRSNFEASYKVIKYGLPLLPGLIFCFLSNWGDHIILQNFKSTEEVGFFNAGYQAMTALTGLASAIPILILPKLIDRALSSPEVERDYINRMGPTIASFWLMIIIPVLIFIPWFFTVIFGSQFENSIPILLVLCATVPGTIFTAIYSVLFELQGRLGRSSLFSAIMFGINILVTLALVAKWGGIGAALGTTLSYFLVHALYALDQHRYLDVNMTKARVLFIFSVFYGLAQWGMGEDLIIRLCGALLGLFCLIMMVRRYKLVDGLILTKLFSGKMISFHPFFSRLLICEKVAHS